MAKGNNPSTTKEQKSQKTSWISTREGKEQLSSHIAKAGKLASSVNESRNIPSSVVKEPFTV